MKKSAKKIGLHRETVRNLADVNLPLVAAGATVLPCYTIPINQCPTVHCE
jgi:hypothetical protein